MDMSKMTRNAFRASLAGGAAIAAFFAYTSVAAQSDRGGATFRATLGELNNSGAQGEATLRLSGRTLNVHITASGLEAGGVHLGHVHGLSEGSRAVDSSCPTEAQDDDGDGFVELAEGLETYGPILIDFMNVDPNQDGTVDFTTTVQLAGNAAAIPLNKRHIVIHGMTVGAVGAGTPGEVNGTAEYKVLLPVLCGEIRNARNSKANDPLDFRTRN